MKLLREPLVHFLALATLVLCIEALRRPDHSEEAVKTVVLPTQTQDRLRLSLTEALGREPAPDELAAAHEEWLDTEVLVQEARRLGLESHDPVVRDRLARQMAFVHQAADQREPTDDELRALYDAGAVRKAADVRFQHVITDDPDHAATLATAWTAGDERSGRASTFADAYGANFVMTLRGSRIGEPVVVESTEGFHALVVLERTWTPLPFEDARDELKVSWRAEQDRLAREQALQALRPMYERVIE